VIQETGVLKGRRRRAVDSTILADAVATQDTVTPLVSAIRKVAREVPGAAEKIAQVCTGHDYSKPGKPGIDWDDPQAKDALVPALVNDANALVEAFQVARLDEDAPSPRWPPGGDAGSSSATAAQPGTTPGSSAAPPPSTCAT